MKHFSLQFETQSDFGYLPFLTRLFKALRLPRAPALTQILVEAYNNAVIHAHKNKKEKWIGIAVEARGKKVKICVTDRGQGISSAGRSRRRGSLWETRGRGLQIIHTFADRVVHKNKNGTHSLEADCTV